MAPDPVFHPTLFPAPPLEACAGCAGASRLGLAFTRILSAVPLCSSFPFDCRRTHACLCLHMGCGALLGPPWRLPSSCCTPLAACFASVVVRWPTNQRPAADAAFHAPPAEAPYVPPLFPPCALATARRKVCPASIDRSLPCPLFWLNPNSFSLRAVPLAHEPPASLQHWTPCKGCCNLLVSPRWHPGRGQ